MKKSIVKRMSFDAIFAALSVVLYIIGPKFPLAGIFPAFLTINFSMLPILITTFMLGPVDGLIVLFVRLVCKAPTTTTMMVGEASDFILGVVVVLVVGLFNKYFKSEKEYALLDEQELKKHHYHLVKHKYIMMELLIIGSWIIGGMISNSFALPLYCLCYTTDVVKGMIKIFPWVNDSNWILYYFTLAIIPFNLIISFVVGIVTLIVDKYIKPFYLKI